MKVHSHRHRGPKRQHRQAQIHSPAVAVIFSQNCTRRVRDIVAVRNRRTQRRAKEGHCSHSRKRIIARRNRRRIQGRCHSRAVAVIFSQNYTRRVRNAVPICITHLSPKSARFWSVIATALASLHNQRRQAQIHSLRRCCYIQSELH